MPVAKYLGRVHMHNYSALRIRSKAIYEITGGVIPVSAVIKAALSNPDDLLPIGRGAELAINRFLFVNCSAERQYD